MLSRSCHGSPHEPCDCDVWQRWVIECSNMNGIVSVDTHTHNFTLQECICTVWLEMYLAVGEMKPVSPNFNLPAQFYCIKV